jgi:hypothetical protein
MYGLFRFHENMGPCINGSITVALEITNGRRMKNIPHNTFLIENMRYG